MPEGLLVGHLITRLERARAGMTCIDRLCIYSQNPGDPLKPEDFQDYVELCDYICAVLKAPWGSAEEAEAVAMAAKEPAVITGKYCL
jgi:hypothetical protein